MNPLTGGFQTPRGGQIHIEDFDAASAHRQRRNEGAAMSGQRGTDLIAAERQRQIDVEGFAPEYDTGRVDELAGAAACYAVGHCDIWAWPWSRRDWKPTPDDRVRELVKAGALIAAAIDAIEASR